jgi:hypothetical protein
MSASKTPAKAPAKPDKRPKARPKPQPGQAKSTLLAGGNPQIAKGEGDAPVQAYIAAMPRRECPPSGNGDERVTLMEKMQHR